MVNATLYTTAITAIRKTATDCRRIVRLLDALKVEYESIIVDSEKTREHLDTLLGDNKKDLPLLFVGDTCIGTCDELDDINEEGKLPFILRKAGYSEKIVGGENISVGGEAVNKVPGEKKKKKIIIVKKKKPPPPPPDDDDDAPPPPPPEDEYEEVEVDDDEPPPPPPEDDLDMEINDNDLPPPPSDDDEPPPPPSDEEPPPPPSDDETPPPPPPEE
eukprot:Tbor_TRINITY_DN5301_c0_g1::TRINITY_DN5301_c0_g1_i1::g.4797::m.4797